MGKKEIFQENKIKLKFCEDITANIFKVHVRSLNAMFLNLFLFTTHYAKNKAKNSKNFANFARF